MSKIEQVHAATGGRGGSMQHVNVRLPEEVVQFYKQFSNYTAAMRHVLTQFAQEAMAEAEEDKE